MMILLVMLLAVFACGFGFWAGYFYESKPQKPKKETVKAEKAEIEKEYENFLNYDGTVQE